MNTKISFRKAKRLSIFKWERVANGQDFDEVLELPELKGLLCKCGFCERYHRNFPNSICSPCPLSFSNKKMVEDVNQLHCGTEGHIYYRYLSEKDEEKQLELASTILDMIKHSKNPERWTIRIIIKNLSTFAESLWKRCTSIYSTILRKGWN